MEPQDILSSEDSVQRKNMSNTADNNVVTDSEMNAVSSSVDSPEWYVKQHHPIRR